MARSLNNLARLYHETQRPAAALQTIQRAVDILQPALGIEHPQTQNALSWLLTIIDSIE